MLVTRARVRTRQRPTPSFVRVELGGHALADVGVEGPLWDQRIKLILPGADGLPELSPQCWWEDFLALPADSGVAMRTYTIAELRGSGTDTTVVVDLVAHLGDHGPGARWAETVRVGDEVLLVAPRRGEHSGGIEFGPGRADQLLVVGDESALPAVVQILRDFPPGAGGAVFLEVPVAADVRPLDVPPNVEVTWLVRERRPVGEATIEAVLAYLGCRSAGPFASSQRVDPEVWETPTWSSSGQVLEEHPVSVTDGRYAWIAGEARMVTTLRRHLVNELGVPRSQVAFMGYWREGVAMRG